PLARKQRARGVRSGRRDILDAARQAFGEPLLIRFAECGYRDRPARPINRDRFQSWLLCQRIDHRTGETFRLLDILSILSWKRRTHDRILRWKYPPSSAR